MNNYPLWWENTITVYNKYENKVTNVIQWYRKVLPNCFWKYVGEKLSVGTTIIETNNTVCRIPENPDYVPKYLWEQLSAYEMEQKFTLGVGDIVVLGEVDEEIDEYKQGKRSSDFMAKYKNLQGCIQIKTLSNNVGAGRCNQHYKITGE